MRHLLCALLFTGSLFGQQYSTAPDSSNAKGTFYVEGITYQYAAGSDYTVVAAAHSVMNRKFVAVKVRVYNAGQHSVTVKPEDVVVEDAVGNHGLAAVPAGVLADKLRKPYNMARYAVSSNGSDGSGDLSGMPVAAGMVTPEMLRMMRVMAAQASQAPAGAGNNLLYTDTPGELEKADAAHRVAECDQVCRLRVGESQAADPLAQLQRGVSADYVEQCSLRSNTIPPHANLGGVLYFPMGKLAQETSAADHIRKRRIVRVTVPVEDQKFQFVLLVE